MTPAERQRQYRARNGARTGQPGPVATAPCGTVSAYKRHLRHGEPTDQACREAWAAFQRARFAALRSLCLVLVLLVVLAACGTAQAAHVDGPPAAMRPRTVCPAGSTVVVVGDSITAIAADRLDTELRLADYVPAINARGGRNIGDGVEAVLGYTYATSDHRCWVIALGTNDIGTGSHWRPAMKDLLSRLPAGDQLWWMRVAVPGGDEINDAVPQPVVTMIDWRPTTAELYDGVHPNIDGVAVWAIAVRDALTQLAP